MFDWWSKVSRSNFVIRLLHWEYWPFGVIQFPLFLYYPWLAFRARSFTFFAGSNPGIPMGGMFGESKHEVLQKVPSDVRPPMAFIQQPATLPGIQETIKRAGLTYPLIFKPDIGERGYMVKRIDNEQDVVRYLNHMKFDFIVQQLVDYPVELGVFYRRFPDEDEGAVISIVMKEMLYVEGNGRSSLQQLILSNERAKLQWPVLRETYQQRLDEILPLGKKFEIVSIGNHCLGTKFINGNHLIDARLSRVFDSLSKQIEGFYFGRYDLRCKSIDHLLRGDFMVLELNGCGAEPAHIYDPGFSLFSAVQVLINHWRSIFTIAEQNRANGYQYLSLKEAIGYYRKFKTRIR